MSVPRLLIAAPNSGSGKTTIATGLMAALSASRTVQGFKAGPDFIDPGYHTLATGRISRNLDTWMLAKDRVAALFANAVTGAEIAIVEGVMGLFDGYDATTERGSSAELAKLLGAPVVLVIDASSMARSAAALALGFRDFDPELNVAGIIANRVSSETHARWVCEAIEAIGLPVLGCVPRTASVNLPERHLGLHTVESQRDEARAFVAAAGELVRQHVDLTAVEVLAAHAGTWLPDPPPPRATPPRVRIAVARDAAFSFYYEDNLDLLRAAGAEIVQFSPLSDSALPDNCHGLYLGGGYPELYAAQLAANRPLLTAIREAIRAGMPAYAECGGLMLLTEAIGDMDGNRHAMVGALPGHTQMVDRLTLGYREVRAARDTLILKQGEVARGHEFHYSTWHDQPDDMPVAWLVHGRTGDDSRLVGFANGNLLASYVHLHFAANNHIAPNFVEACTQWQRKRTSV